MLEMNFPVPVGLKTTNDHIDMQNKSLDDPYGVIVESCFFEAPNQHDNG